MIHPVAGWFGSCRIYFNKEGSWRICALLPYQNLAVCVCFNVPS